MVVYALVGPLDVRGGFILLLLLTLDPDVLVDQRLLGQYNHMQGDLFDVGN
jgi:hypothetical protein